MAKKASDIKAFSFLDLDPRAVADQLRRAGWTRDQVLDNDSAVSSWSSAILYAFCAAEEAGRDGES